MNILEKLHESMAKLSDEATGLALLKDQYSRDIAGITNNIADIDIRLGQIVGAIKEIDSIIKETEREQVENMVKKGASTKTL